MKNSRIVSVADMRDQARKKLPRIAFEFLEGGALDERTLQDNLASFRSRKFKQRVLVDVSLVDLAAKIGGRQLRMPLLVSPVGGLTVFHPSGDLAAVRAAARSRCIFVHSAWSGYSLEEVADVEPGAVWAQVSFWRDEREYRRHVETARRSEIDTLVVAGDVGIYGKRERELHHGLSIPPRPPLLDCLNVLTKPAWGARALFGEKLAYGNIRSNGAVVRMKNMTQWMTANRNPAAVWDEVRKLRREWNGRLVIKGVMCVEDCRIAMDAGADGIFVSNHGGRQFDAQPATLDVLRPIADFVNGAAEIYVDGGVRRGSDIVALLATGASAVGVGRPIAYGLASAGERGVDRVLDILQSEMREAMAFTGCRGVDDISPHVFADADHGRFLDPT